MILQQQLPPTPLRRLVKTGGFIFLFALIAAAATAAAIMLPQPKGVMFVGAAIYVATYIYLTWKRPDIALLLVYAGASVASDVSNGLFAKFSISEANLVLALPAFYLYCIRRKQVAWVGPIAVPVAIYLAVSLLSSAINWRGYDALISLIQMALYLVIAVSVFANFAVKPEHLLRSLYAMVIAGCGATVWALVFHYPLGKNGTGDLIASTLQVAIILLLATESRNTRRKFLLIAALILLTIGLVFSLSRGSWLGALSGIIVMFTLRREFKSLFRLLLLLIPIAVVCWMSLPQDLKAYSTGVGKDRMNIELRYQSVDIAKKYFYESPVYGTGVGLRKEYDATNIALMVLAETGVAGLFGFALIHFAFYRMVWVTQKRLPVKDALHPLLCVGAALVLARLMHGMVDHYWTRGVLMTAWASAGMTTAAYFAVCRRAGVRRL